MSISYEALENFKKYILKEPRILEIKQILYSIEDLNNMQQDTAFLDKLQANPIFAAESDLRSNSADLEVAFVKEISKNLPLTDDGQRKWYLNYVLEEIDDLIFDYHNRFKVKQITAIVKLYGHDLKPNVRRFCADIIYFNDQLARLKMCINHRFFVSTESVPFAANETFALTEDLNVMSADQPGKTFADLFKRQDDYEKLLKALIQKGKIIQLADGLKWKLLKFSKTSPFKGISGLKDTLLIGLACVAIRSISILNIFKRYLCWP